MIGPQLTWNLQPFTSCSRQKYNVKLRLKSLAQFQWMQMTDRHLLTTLKASSPAHSGTRASRISYYSMGLSPNAVFPKGSGSVSSVTQQQSCFTEITNCKLFTKMKGNVKGSRQKCRPYHSVLECCWKFLQSVQLFEFKSNFLSLIRSIN